MGQTHWGVREPEPSCLASCCRVGAGLGSGIEQPRLRPGSPGHRVTNHVSQRECQSCLSDPAQGRRGAGAAGRGTDLFSSLAGRRVHPTPGKMEPRASWPQQRILCRLRERSASHQVCTDTLQRVLTLCLRGLCDVAAERPRLEAGSQETPPSSPGSGDNASGLAVGANTTLPAPSSCAAPRPAAAPPGQGRECSGLRVAGLTPSPALLEPSRVHSCGQFIENGP